MNAPVMVRKPRLERFWNIGLPGGTGSRSFESISARWLDPTDRIRFATSPLYAVGVQPRSQAQCQHQVQLHAAFVRVMTPTLVPRWYVRPSAVVGKFALLKSDLFASRAALAHSLLDKGHETVQ